jgi:hypothetical protein
VQNDEGTVVGKGKLEELLHHVTSRCSTSHDRQYAADLGESVKALGTDSTRRTLTCPRGYTRTLEALVKESRQHMKVVHESICAHLLGGLHSVTRTAKMLPRLSPTSLLSHLASDKITALPEGWKISLVQYGLSITALQHAERLLAVASNPATLLSELENPGHLNWDPMLHPGWLLLEIENDLLIRQDQAQISQEMIDPSSGSNSVIQLNMGRGKTSVIVPNTAADLTDGMKLVRVVVLRPLAMQMFQLLVRKLGGTTDPADVRGLRTHWVNCSYSTRAYSLL